MKYIGVALLFLGALLLSWGYKRRLISRSDSLSEMLRLLRHVRTRVAEYLEPPSVWAASFTSEDAWISELLFGIRMGKTPAEAYSVLSAHSPLSPAAGDVLRGLFRGPHLLVSGAAADIDSAVAELSEIYEKERSLAEEGCRVFAVWALMLSAGVGVLVI